MDGRGKARRVRRARALRWGVGCALALSLAACNRSSLPRTQEVPDLPAAPPGPLDLPVRVHLLTSETVPALDATLTDVEVHAIFRAVNQLWSPASIHWSVEDIRRAPAPAQERFREHAATDRSPSRDLLEALLPVDRLLVDGWNVVIGRRLRGPPGIYFHRSGAVLTSEVGPDRRRASPNMVRVLAHELGHALGLHHVRCAAGGNLMAPGCPPLDAGPLDETQVEAARRRAYRSLTSPDPAGR